MKPLIDLISTRANGSAPGSPQMAHQAGASPADARSMSFKRTESFKHTDGEGPEQEGTGVGSRERRRSSPDLGRGRRVSSEVELIDPDEMQRQWLIIQEQAVAAITKLACARTRPVRL